MGTLYSASKNSGEMNKAVANQVSGSKGISMPAVKQVTQLKREAKAITGLTHLVEMTAEGSIYNENYEENEFEEVSEAAGDIIQIETSDTWLSRRGPNQEIHGELDKAGPQNYQWFRVMRLRNRDLSSRKIYVRQGMFVPYTTIDLPRDRRRVDGAIAAVIDIIKEVTNGKNSSDMRGFTSIGDEVLNKVKRELSTIFADHALNLDAVAEIIKGFPVKVNKVFDMPDSEIRAHPIGQKPDRISEPERNNLMEALIRLQQVYADYNQPKGKVGVKGLIGRSELEQLHVTGLDLGGIGTNAGYMDVNVSDDTNSSNPIVIGDAMNLQATFQPACVNKVIAELLPLVLMVNGTDSTAARIIAIRKVLTSVNYVTGNGGSARIQFNDNSKKQFRPEEDEKKKDDTARDKEVETDVQVKEPALRAIAGEFGFSLTNDLPPDHSPLAYRKFTFTRG
jgi:hypothetical protein